MALYNQDSITQFSFSTEHNGWGSYVADAYQRKLDVMNRGFSGYNTDWAIPILRQLLPTVEQQANSQNRIRLITIFFGANDAALPFAYQHVPITRYMNNLSEMIDMIQNPNSKYHNPDCKILLITQPPVNEVQWRKRCNENGEKMNRTAEVAKSYAEAAKEIASQHNVPVVDLWSELMLAAEKSDLSNFLLDGLHLNTSGNQVLAKALLKGINANFRDLDPQTIIMKLPEWREVPLEDYEKALQY
ncbi:hypothetical protein NQZ79_g5723 [Umbelopsis isabellina]|nr:hypothetical protein NQZ79_g5723 [Umbelopsis isabellina]